jgi:hypothetical protein
VERERGRVKSIGPGQSKKFLVEVEVLTDAAAVKETAAAIGKIQGSKKMEVNEEPES